MEVQMTDNFLTSNEKLQHIYHRPTNRIYQEMSKPYYPSLTTRKKHFEHTYTVAEGKLKIDMACFNLQASNQLSVFQTSRLCW
jgi:hypothetical protein